VFNYKPEFKGAPKAPTKGFSTNFKLRFNAAPDSPSAPLAGRYLNVESPLAQLAYISQSPGFSTKQKEEATNTFNQLLGNSWGQNNLLI